MSGDSIIVDMPKPQARSRIGNGSALLDGIDGRSSTFRRYRDVLGALVIDAFAGQPTEAQMQLARRAASLSVWAEERESAMANGEAVDMAAYTTCANALRRLLQDIGLERRARPIASMRDRLMGQS